MVESVGYRAYGVNTIPEVEAETKAYRRAQETSAGTANFEGRRDFDSFEKESHTGRNIAIGTGVVAAAGLYTLAALMGRGKGLNMFGKTLGKFKGENLNFMQKGVNKCLDGAYKSAKYIKTHTYDKVANFFKKGGSKGGGASEA